MNRLGSILIFAGLIFFLCTCSTSRKLAELKNSHARADLALPAENSDPLAMNSYGAAGRPKSDSIVVKDEKGNDIILMNAVKDEATGEMVATEQLQAAIITGRFKKVAERCGKIDISYEVIVPQALIDSKWQVRLYPEIYLINNKKELVDSVKFKSIRITGEKYHEEQLRGYERYDKFIASIITDSSEFWRKGMLEIYLKRNIPEIYALKQDSTYIGESDFKARFGTTEQDAIDHYTRYAKLVRNNYKQEHRTEYFDKYVKLPYDTENTSIDTVVYFPRRVSYICTETIETRPKLKKGLLYLTGEIYDGPNRIYLIPRSDSLEYNISSLTHFAKDRKRYLKKVIYRKAEANASYNIVFKVAKWDIDRGLENNDKEIRSIEKTLRNLLNNTEFDLDGIDVTANCSPEGTSASNKTLSERRGRSVSDYFSGFIKARIDSINREMPEFIIDENGEMHKSEKMKSDIKFSTKNEIENWTDLDRFIHSDTLITDATRAEFEKVMGISNLDAREASFARGSQYRYIRENIYPKLRTVRFDFHLHRKGMVKDTVETTELDSVYIAGVEALKDSDYARAIEILKNYPDDYNTAVAYLAMDRNLNARNILEEMQRTPDVNYMLAIVYSRMQMDKEAVQCYLDACKEDDSYIARGNLDPEISALIKAYNLNRQEEEDDEFILPF